MMKCRQLGTFLVDQRFFQDMSGPRDGANLFHEIVVLETKHHWQADQVEYFAMSPQFRSIANGETIPRYEAFFDDGAIHPTWIELDRAES